MTSFLDVNAKCPFYKTDDGRAKVICEGIDTAVCIKLSWHKTDGKGKNEKEEFRKFFKEKCSSKYEGCPIYRMIMSEKYD